MFIYNSFQDIDSSKPQPRPETGRGRQKDLSFSLPPVLLNPAPSIRTFSHFSFFLFFFLFARLLEKNRPVHRKRILN